MATAKKTDVVVFGGSGRVGSCTIGKLLELENYRIKVVGRNQSKFQKAK